MRRLALILAGGATWLFLAAFPVSADNGPHVASINNGSAGLNADSCSACHRAHTAQGQLLLIDDQPAMCLVCHGPTGTGATTDVQDGIQYSAGSVHVGPQAQTSDGVVGALRAGGFANARIGSTDPTRYSYDTPILKFGYGFTGFVPVATSGTRATSGHMSVVDGVVSATSGIAWGNAAGPRVFSKTVAYAGPTVTLTCTTCHNPHGNGQYRILEPVPAPIASTGSTFYTLAGGAPVTDADAVPKGQVRNYTNPPAQYLSQLSPTIAPDYWRYCVPDWKTCGGTTGGLPNRGDKPNGLDPDTFATEMTYWCISCHTRYLAAGSSATTSTKDKVFAYRHTTDARPECTQCHVAHGSNAQMDGTYSRTFPNPDGTTSGSSRLLKIDNRGTCQMCHDPTGNVTSAGVTTPTPTPTPTPGP